MSEDEYMSNVPYANLVGCLMYAMVCTRLDLTHFVSQVYKFMFEPGKRHWEVVDLEAPKGYNRLWYYV